MASIDDYDASVVTYPVAISFLAKGLSTFMPLDFCA